MNMKKYIFLAASVLTLASCTSDDFLGDTPGNVQSNTSAINFDGGTGKITRATTQTGADAAKTLGNSYVVYGYKTVNDVPTTVFDHYTIKWKGLKDKTESNTQGWEYVGQNPNSLSSLTTGAEQTIKYWDYSATQYDFVAFSFGTAKQGDGEGEVKATAVTTTPKLSYTLTGAVNDLAKCFIADRITAKPTVENKKNNLLVAYKDNVQFNFRSLSTKVTMGIYETIPGYSVKDVKFYSSDKNKLDDAQNKPTLYAKDKNIPAKNGTITVTFPTTTETNNDYNKAHVKFNVATGSENSSSIQFGNLSTVNKEKNEKTESGFIGRDITTFSTPKKSDGTTKDYNVVIPAEVGDLTLKVDYTLESIDGSGETIKVTGATAVVPEKYTNWEPNYAYTYIFKISDKTNGSTGGGNDPAGLYPITFDAIVTETETGKQETITTVETRSITTYAKDAINNEYLPNTNIYVSVSSANGTSEKLYKEITPEEGQTVSYKYYAKLYKLSVAEGTTKSLTEAEAEAILKNNNTLGGKTLTEEQKNTAEVFDSRFVDKIEAKDAVDGVEVKGNFFKFTPTGEGIYVFAYENGEKSYKVIKVTQ